MPTQKRYVSALAVSVFLGATVAVAADLRSPSPPDQPSSREELLFEATPGDRAFLGPLHEGGSLADASIERIGRRDDTLWLVVRHAGARGRIGIVCAVGAAPSAGLAPLRVVSRDLSPAVVDRLSRALAHPPPPPAAASSDEPGAAR